MSQHFWNERKFPLPDADPEEPHEMGDVNKTEMSEEESDKFDEKRNEAMAAFADAEWWVLKTVGRWLARFENLSLKS